MFIVMRPPLQWYYAQTRFIVNGLIELALSDYGSEWLRE